MEKNFDVIVIGGGPGGYVCAIRSAQLGLKTACIESRGTLGGTCLNVGCIPSKSLLNLSDNFRKAKKDFGEQGIEISDLKLNIKKMMLSKDKSVQILTKGVEFLFKKNKVTYIKGKGEISSPNDIIVSEGEKKTTYKSKNIVIATGSQATSLPGLKIDEKNIVSSTGALSLSEVPKELIVIGGGYIGLEMGSVWSRLGSKVTVLEYLDTNKIDYIVYDWTERNENISTVLESYGRSGVPLYLLFKGDGTDAIILPEILTETMVLNALRKL